jgi:hypothetical protein
MNVYEWMGAAESEPPLHEDDSREDPGHRPQVPTEDGDDTNRQHHGDDSPAGGGRSTEDDDEMHCTEHTIQDPQMMEDLTHSQESIIEPIRKFFKMHNRGSDYIEVDGNNKASGVQLLQTLEKTYGSKEWLSKQTHKPGQVKVGDLSDRINLDKIEQTITETGAINAQFQNAQIQAIITNVKQIKPAVDLLNPPKLTDEAFDKLKAILPDLKPVTEIIKNPVRGKTSLLTGKSSDESREALSIDEVEGTAQAIAKALKDAQLIWEDAGKAIDQLIPAFHDARTAVVDDGAESKSYNNDAWKELLGAVHRKVFGQGSPDVIAAYRQFEGACLAAVIYMERSFTGGKEVSNEEFTVSMEGIFDKLIKAVTGGKDEKGTAVKPVISIDHAKEVKRFVETGATTLGSVEVSGKKSVFLDGIAKGVKSWSSSVRADLREYNKLYRDAASYDKVICKWEDKYKDELESFCTEEDRTDEFAALLARMVKDQPKPWVDVMKTSHKFMGYQADDWDDGELGFELHPVPNNGATITVPALDEAAVREIKKVLMELAKTIDDIGSIESELPWHGDDFTDPPYRMYFREDKVIEQANKFTIHAQVSNNPQDMVDAIINRLYSMMKGIIEYVMDAEGTVSNEGFVDAIKALFKTKPKELDLKHGIDKEHFKELEKTLLNDSWLKQQTLTEGNVTVRFPDAAMKGNYKPLVKRILQELDKVAQTNAKLSEKWFNPIRQGVDLIVSGNIKGANLEQVQSFNETVVYDNLDFDVDYAEPQYFTEDNAEVELPALDIAGIKDTTNAIIELVQARWDYGKTSLGPGAKWPDGSRMHLILDTRGELQSELKQLYSEVESILDYFDEHFYTDQFSYYDLVDGLAEPLLHWIQKSISGVKVSNEDFGSLGKP